MKKIFFCAALCALLFVSACRNRSQQETVVPAADSSVAEAVTPVVADENGYLVKVGDVAPDFTVELTDGTKWTLSEQRGKVVMLQFTASWCGICRQEMPHIEKRIWLRHQQDPDFVLVGIDRDEPLEKALQLAESTGITYPLALDPGADVFALYADRSAGITRNVLIDKEGKIVMLTRLFKEDEFASLVGRIDKMLE